MKVKAEELRIGNYFMFGAMRHMVSYHDIANLCKAQQKGEDIASYQPIPLTEEWLLKFGFEKMVIPAEVVPAQDDVTFYINESDYEIEVGSEIFFWIEEVPLKIEYVHQLQNLYFALTNTELTHNP